MATQSTTFSANSGQMGLLRGVLLGNASFSIITGLAFLLWSQPIATFLGGVPALEIIALGVILLPFAAFVAWAATRPTINRQAVRIIIAMDIAWVLGSALLLLTGVLPLTSGGKWAIGIVADIVACFALGQFIGLRRAAFIASQDA